MKKINKIENIISDYIDKKYSKYDLYDEYIPLGDGLSVNKIMPTDTGFYVEGEMLFDMHPEVCDSEPEDGCFWATVDKSFEILDLHWEIY